MYGTRLLFAPFALLLLGTAQSQTFMRAYAVPDVSFSPPQGFLFSFGAVVLDEGYLFTTLDGLACFTDMNGDLGQCVQLQTSTGTMPVQLQLRSVERAADGGFYFQALQGADTALVLRTNAATEVLWQKGTTFSNVALNEQVIPLADGGCLMAHVRQQGPSTRPVLSSYGTNGSVNWQRTYRAGVSTLGNMSFRDVVQLLDGGLVAVGRYNPATPPRPLVARLNADGTVLWAKEIAPFNNGNADALAVSELPSGQLRIALGDVSPEIRLAVVDISSTGDLVSARGYLGLTGTPNDIRFLPDGALTGVVGNSGSAFRIAADGTPVFATEHLGPSETFMLGEQLLPTPDGGQVFHGQYSASFFGDMTPVLYKTGPLGQLPAPFGNAYSITLTAFAPSITNGSMVDSLVNSSFVPSLQFLPTAALADTLFGVATGVAELPLSSIRPVVSPNPAIDRITLEHMDEVQQVYFINAAGKLVQRTNGGPSPLQIDISTFVPGVYHALIVTRAGQRATTSFIVAAEPR